MNNKHVFVDYEGTLSELPKGSGEGEKVTISDLLFGNVFSRLNPIFKVRNYLLNQNFQNVYVLGIVDVGQEIKQKEEWLKKHYSFIPEDNYIFVSSEHTKVEIINEYVKNKKLNKNDVIFIDDKQKHLDPAIQEGYVCLNVDDIK